jgi:two-component system catabolic regulation response regulator CreB
MRCAPTACRRQHCLLGREALQRLRAEPWDAVILDIGLPDITGFELCRELRTFSEVPVIFLSARGGEIDRVLGLELGRRRLRGQALLAARAGGARARAPAPRRRSGGRAAGWREIGAFAIDAAGQRIRYQGRAAVADALRVPLLAALLKRPGAILSREQLMDDVWRDARRPWTAPWTRT